MSVLFRVGDAPWSLVLITSRGCRARTDTIPAVDPDTASRHCSRKGLGPFDVTTDVVIAPNHLVRSRSTVAPSPSARASDGRASSHPTPRLAIRSTKRAWL